MEKGKQKKGPSSSIYYFPSVLELSSTACSVNLLFPCSSSWSSGGGVCCADSQVSVPGRDAPPLSRCWAESELFIL